MKLPLRATSRKMHTDADDEDPEPDVFYDDLQPKVGLYSAGNTNSSGGVSPLMSGPSIDSLLFEAVVCYL